MIIHLISHLSSLIISSSLIIFPFSFLRGPCVWNGSGKYLMFFTWLPFVSPSTLLQAQHTSETSQSYDPTLEKLEFDWIPLSQLWSFLPHAPVSSSFSAEVAEEGEKEKEKELHPFFQSTLQIPGVREALAEFANTPPPSLLK
jgi:hypothetical protein